MKASSSSKIINLCPACGLSHEIDPSFIGLYKTCRSCGKKFITHNTPEYEKVLQIQKENNDARNKRREQAEKIHTLFAGIFSIAIIIGVVLLIIWGLSSCVSGCNAHSEKIRSQEVAEGSLSVAKVLCEDKILGALKAPSTAKITFEVNEKFQKTYKFAGYIDAQNSFGAMIRNRFSVKMEYIGDSKYRFLEFSIQ